MTSAALDGSRHYRRLMGWLTSCGADPATIIDQPSLYAAIARALGKPLPEAMQPAFKNQAARAIRHYLRSGELTELPLAPAIPPMGPVSKRKVRVRLMRCCAIGELTESRPGFLADSLAHGRTTLIVLLFEKQGGICHYCGEQILLAKSFRKSPRFATVDHVHPKSMGGIREVANTVAACAECNFEKGATGYEEFVGRECDQEGTRSL